MKEFQHRVWLWFLKCFPDPAKYRSTKERSFRFYEEATEMVQSLGVTKAECKRLIDYVYSRPIGDPKQELGGVLITLSVLSTSVGLEMESAAEDELVRVNTPDVMAKIHTKQVSKNLNMVGQERER